MRLFAGRNRWFALAALLLLVAASTALLLPHSHGGHDFNHSDHPDCPLHRLSLLVAAADISIFIWFILPTVSGRLKIGKPVYPIFIPLTIINGRSPPTA